MNLISALFSRLQRRHLALEDTQLQRLKALPPPPALDALLHQQRFVVLDVVAVLSGIALLLWNEWAQLAGRPEGIAWMQGAALCWALGTIWMRRAQLTLPAQTLVVWMMLMSAAVIMLLAVALEPPQRWHFSTAVWVSLVWSVLINYGAAQVIWFALARELPAATSAMSVMAVPLIGTLSAPLIAPPPKNVMPTPSTPSSVRICSVTKVCFASFAAGPSASGSSSGSATIRLSISVIFMGLSLSL